MGLFASLVLHMALEGSLVQPSRPRILNGTHLMVSIRFHEIFEISYKRCALTAKKHFWGISMDIYIPCSSARKLKIVTMSILPKSMYRFNPEGFCFGVDIHKLILKYIQKCKETRRGKTSSNKKRPAQWLMLVIPALWEANAGNHLRSGVQNQPDQHGETLSLLKI